MFNSFLTSFKLKNTYRVNSIIYSIRAFPFMKKIVSNKLYQNKGLKIFGNIISGLAELFSIFLGKFLYIWLCISSILMVMKTNQIDTFLHIFVFLTFAGALINTYMFNPTKDKYYAMVLMNMDAKKYTLSNYYYALLKTWIGFLPFTILFGHLLNIPIWIRIILPFFVILSKMIISAYNLKEFQKKSKVINENILNKYMWGVIVFLLIISYVLPYIGITINQTIFLIIFFIILLLGIYSLFIIQNYPLYKKFYKKLLVPDNVYMVENQTGTQGIKENFSNQITLNENSTSTKTGFAYFHELFVKRHYKILTKKIKTQCFVITIILLIVGIIAFMNQEFSNKINHILLIYLPYFTFIMYILNCGPTLTQAMFINCDHSMLTYQIYRNPKVILGVFKERLKTLLLFNFFPALLIGSGLALLLFISGGTTEPLNYIVLVLTIIAMSIFFSVHNLILYYLIQPYNINTEIKSSTYHLVQTLTYFVTFMLIKAKIPTLYFGITAIIFSILYSLISLILVYKYASKTFKIRN